MKFSVSLQAQFRLIRCFSKIFGIWPSAGCKRDQGLLRKLAWWLYFANSACMLPLSASAIYAYRHNLYVASWSLTEIILEMEIILILIYTRSHRRQLRSLLEHAELRLANSQLNGANFYSLLYLFKLACVMFVTGIFVMRERPEVYYHGLLLTAKYPFDVDRARTALLLQQQVFLVHIFVIQIFDAIVIFLIYTCTDCLKSLESEISSVGTYQQLVDWITRHVQILGLINETNKILRFMVLKSVVSFMFYVFTAALRILNPYVILHWSLEFIILLTVFTGLYLYTENAQAMANASENIAMTIYSTAWYNENAKMVLAKAVIIQRCQRGLRISVNGFMSSFDRQFLGSILCATISYLLTIRAVTGSK